MSPITILLVEDNQADARLTIEVLREGKLINDVNVVPDGVEALSFLRHEEGYADAGSPDIILLDLNLPRMDGRELLAHLKSDPELRHIPVIVLTTSSAVEDINAAYNRYANCYITKPVNLDDFIDVVKSIEDFWFSIVRLPSE
jgi:CheY-like chemotaxis protein